MPTPLWAQTQKKTKNKSSTEALDKHKKKKKVEAATTARWLCPKLTLIGSRGAVLSASLSGTPQGCLRHPPDSRGNCLQGLVDRHRSLLGAPPSVPVSMSPGEGAHFKCPPWEGDCPAECCGPQSTHHGQYIHGYPRTLMDIQ